jgi:signal transduction histidine kinase/ActR/RegA family two-component response regulator
VKQAKPLSSSLFRNMAAVFWILCLGLGLAWVWGDLKHLNEDMLTAEKNFTEARMNEVRMLITNLTQNIEYQIDSAGADQEAMLRDRVDQAAALAQRIYGENKDRLSDEDLVATIRESMRPLRFDGEQGYYFVLTLDGTRILQPHHPETEGRNMLEMQDPEGRFVVRDIIALALESGEGAYSYLWTKPGLPGEDHAKTSYVKLFEPLGLVIGTGQYFDDFIASEQEAILRRIRRISFGKEGYVFVNTYDGTAVVMRSNKYKPGDNIWDITDPNGYKIFQEELRAASVPEGDFINYTWIEPGTTKPVRKVSFIKGIDRWEWLLGAGVYLDDVEQALAQRRETMKQVIVRAVLQILVAFVVAFLLALFFARRLARKIQAELHAFGDHFQDAVSTHRPIDTSGLAYTEFQGFAGSINEMLEERRNIEEELLKARNLESIGVLAGGIAHDFNNLLTAIMGNISLARDDLPAGNPAEESLVQAEIVSERARDLTQQLLAFAKGGAPVRSLANVGTIIQESAVFSLRGSSVQLELDLPEDLLHAEVDSGQFSQVVGNLALNAGQAMPAGGLFKITARNLHLADDNELSLARGPYIALDFRDSGEGIPEENLGRIFDPYFTTKAGGTGLGLASVYAIIKNHEGMIRVESRRGRGTVFRVWIPARPGNETVVQATNKQSQTFSARVLIMEDDPSVSNICQLMLERLGCQVEATGHGEDALAAYEREMKGDHPFELVVMDLTIRGGMGGKETIGHLLTLDPEAAAVVSSGYSNNPVMANYMEHGFLGVIRKPYKLAELRHVLSQVLPPSE